MNFRGAKRVAKWIWRFVIAVLLLIIAVPLLLYIPFVQDIAKDIAIHQVNKRTGYEIALDRLRLRFPLRVELDRVSVYDKAEADTMLSASSVDVDIAFLPLFRGDIDVVGLGLEDANYRMGTPDSLMYLKARIRCARINDGIMNLSKGLIDIDNARVEGAKIRLVIKPDSVPSPVDTTSTKPLRIKARKIELADVDYSMVMLPIIDSIGAHIDKAVLADGIVDTGSRRINAALLSIDGVEAAYITPSVQQIESAAYRDYLASDTIIEPPSAPWTITADELSLTARRALYATFGAKPVAGIDPDYIYASDISIKVDSFYTRGTDIRVPLRQLKGRERSGLTLEASGVFGMDSTRMWLDNFMASANSSQISITEAALGLGDLTSDPNLPLALIATARINPADVILAMPSLKSMLSPLAARGAITLASDIYGTPSRLNVRRLDINAANIVKMNADGAVFNIMNLDRIGGQLTLDGTISDGSMLTRILPPALLPAGLHIPALKLAGKVDYSPGAVSGDLRAVTSGGRLMLDGKWVARKESYDADLALNAFPVDAFMPELGIGRITGQLKAKGHGYNPLALSTSMDVDLDLQSIAYKGEEITGITLAAHTGGGRAQGRLLSTSPRADLDIDFDAAMSRDDYAWNLSGDIRDLDLRALHLTPDTCNGSLSITSSGHYNPLTSDIDGSVAVTDLLWQLPGMTFVTPEASASLKSTREAVNASLQNGDLDLRLGTRCDLQTLMARLGSLSAVADTIVKRRSFDVDLVQHSLPPIEVALSMGSKNLVAEFLQDRGTMFNNLRFDLHNDSLLTVAGSIYGFESGSTTLDTININAYQRGKTLVYQADINNAPGSMDNFAHVKLNGFLADNRLSAFLTQSNLAGKKGFDIGLLATTTDSVVTARLVPTSPTLAYRSFTLNPDNFLSYNLYTQRIDGNLSLSDGHTSLHIYAVNGADPDKPEDVVAELKNLQLSDYLTISPFAPPISGNLSANMRFTHSKNIITGNGDVQLSDFKYDRNRVGDFDLAMNVTTDPSTGFIKADADLWVDSVKTITLSGMLNDTIAKRPLQLDMQMIHFPLRVANPFIPADIASLDGTLNGNMKVTGEGIHTKFDGHLKFDSASVKVKMLGTSLKFSEEEIPVVDNIVHFNNFTVKAVNDNPLFLNGRVDVSDLANVGMDLNLYAHDIQVVDSDRPRGADVYGKGFLDINANVKGNMEFLRADASVALLSGSRITYVLGSSQSAALALGANDDMVHFVQFNDTTAVMSADSLRRSDIALVLDAHLKIAEGTTINVDLSSSGTDKVSIQGNGALTYTSSPVNDGRLVGRFTINSGYVRYTPPMLSQKTFNFEEGSYVSFTGDMLNPTLNLHAYDVMKANVTRQGENSRLVNFDVSIGITNTLDNMNVAFDLSTDDDITVSNELASMSPEQRASQAMNMLLYGIYSGNGTTGNANIGGNLLYSFVESTLNSWMANNIKGVDISFGIDQYDKTFDGSTTTATNYSYHVSKTLFNDRFKIIVGGSYSTDNDGSDESIAESLFNDISAEYMLNRAGTMYVRIFRHTGFESILEGEVTQTGVGFVYKRRIQSLGDMFKFLRPHKAAKAKEKGGNE